MCVCVRTGISAYIEMTVVFGAFRDDTGWSPGLCGSHSAVIFTTKQNVGNSKQKLWRDRQLEQLVQSRKAKHITDNCLQLCSKGSY